jgi:lipoyl(octanoyl) transferase
MSQAPIRVRNLGRTEYRQTWQAMQDFTNRRDRDTADELWLTEHDPVFTQGLNGRAEHLLSPGDIPVLQIDRGGQVTYHGPGQLVLYCLLNITRRGLGVKGLVTLIERSVIQLLWDYDVGAQSRAGAPGVYVGDAKIAALGLRIRKGCCYHGLSLNVLPASILAATVISRSPSCAILVSLTKPRSSAGNWPAYLLET